VLGRLESIVLWIEDGDLVKIQRATGLTPYRCDMPAPTMPMRGSSLLMPEDLVIERQRQNTRARTRLIALSHRRCLGRRHRPVATLTSFALQERNMLREKVAELAPRAGKVMDHKSGVAGGRARGGSRHLAAADAAALHGAEVVERGQHHALGMDAGAHEHHRPHAERLAGAGIHAGAQNQRSARPFRLGDPAPVIASDNSATFEMKGARAE
jgi:hypothetical protein